MNLFKAILKLPLALYALPLRSIFLMKVLFQRVMPKSFWDYYDQVFLNDYPHIHRVISWAKNESSPIIYDIGGGTGTTIDLFLKHLPLASIIGFEPIKDNFQTITDNFKGNSRLTLHHSAAGATDMESEIHVASRVTSSSILPLSPEESGDSTYLEEALTHERSETISIKRLEPFLLETSGAFILKLDVQGFELEVLKGCGMALNQIEYIVLEVSNHGGYEGAPLYFDIDEFMRKNGFAMADIFPGIKSNNYLKEWDCIYKRIR